MTSQLKWDSGLRDGNSLFLCHNDIVLNSHKISESVADLTGVTKRKKKRAKIPFFKDRCTLYSRMIVEQWVHHAKSIKLV